MAKEILTLEEVLKNKDVLKAEKMLAIKECASYDTPVALSKSLAMKSGNANSDVKTIVGNTYYIMDKHQDVHIKDNFAESIAEDTMKFHLVDHQFKLTAQVGVPQKIYEKTIAWKDLGIDKDGDTQALLMDTKIIDSFQPGVAKMYKDGQINQHSVGMRYGKIDFAANTDDERYVKDKERWDKYYPMLGNPDEADKTNYFWVVSKASLREISAVLAGSNHVTPTIKEEDILDEQKAFIEEFRKASKSLRISEAKEIDADNLKALLPSMFKN